MWNAARLAILGDQPITRFLNLPDLEVIDDVTLTQVQDWHQINLTQAPSAVAVSGAIDETKAGEAIDALLAHLPIGGAVQAPETQANFIPRTVLFHAADAEKTTMALLGQLPPTSEGSDIYDLMALSVFGRPDGPLFEAVRTNLGATYGIQPVYTNYDRATRLLTITGEY